MHVLNIDIDLMDLNCKLYTKHITANIMLHFIKLSIVSDPSIFGFRRKRLFTTRQVIFEIRYRWRKSQGYTSDYHIHISMPLIDLYDFWMTFIFVTTYQMTLFRCTRHILTILPIKMNICSSRTLDHHFTQGRVTVTRCNGAVTPWLTDPHRQLTYFWTTQECRDPPPEHPRRGHPVPISLVYDLKLKSFENHSCSNYEHTGIISHKFAHVTTAVLSWHVQNCDLIRFSVFTQEQHTFLQTLDHELSMRLCEMVTLVIEPELRHDPEL